MTQNTPNCGLKGQVRPWLFVGQEVEPLRHGAACVALRCRVMRGMRKAERLVVLSTKMCREKSGAGG
jgi:hypothetical protein